MKKIILVLILFLAIPSFANDIPSYLKDGTITVTLKDGKTYTFSTNEYKVVSRKQVKTQLVNPVLTKVEHKETKKNLVSIEAVSSQNGLDVEHSASTTNVETKRKVGAGLMYQRNFYKNYWFGGRVDSNGGGALNLGVGF